MNDCKYCGATNPAAVFNCLKCNALMPVRPAPVQNITVAQERRPVVRNAPVNPIPQLPTATQSFTSLCVYFGVGLGVVGLFVAMFFFLNRVQPLSTPVNYKTTSTTADSGPKRIKASGGILTATTEDNFNEMMRAAVAGDDAALSRMGADGKVFRLQDGTKIKIIDSGISKSKVIALDGAQAGRAGWLPNEFIGD